MYIHVCPNIFYSRKFIGHGFIPFRRGPFYSVPLTIPQVKSLDSRDHVFCVSSLDKK